ncbi:hypothetical protein WA158_007211 [Blastocystis sp. Blastoise]
MNKIGLFLCFVALCSAFDPNYIMKLGQESMRKIAEYIKVDDKFPCNTNNGDVVEDYVHYNYHASWDWVSGFYGAELWQMYEFTHEEEWKELAIKYTAKMAKEANNTGTHDLGFMVGYPFQRAYKLTGNEEYKKVVLQAAKSLASRYDSRVGLIRSWGAKTDKEFQVIVDNLMNLDMLFWATKMGGDNFVDLSIHHLNRTITDFLRADYSHYHEVIYETATGKLLRKANPQGKATETTWARGQAWGVYGFFESYKWTGDKRYLETALAMGEWFMSHLPEDHVPLWDYDADENDPRDSSSAAIVASAYLDIYEETKDEKYKQYAFELLEALSTDKYLADPATHDNLLNHGTVNLPGKVYDNGIIYGDFYFMEACKKVIERKLL